MALMSNFAPAFVSFVNRDGTHSKKKYLYVFPLKNLGDYLYYAETYYMDIGMNAPVYFEGFVQNPKIIPNVEYKFAIPNEYTSSTPILENAEEKKEAEQLGFQILEKIGNSRLKDLFHFWNINFGKITNVKYKIYEYAYQQFDCGTCTELRLE